MKTNILLTFLICFTALASNVNSADLADDEVVIFDGETRLNYPGNLALEVVSPATIEFWVSPSWIETAKFAPCILSSLSDDGVNFAVHIGADRNNIGLYAGNRYVSLPYDFTDGLMHHVTLISLAPNLSEVRIDGESIGMLGLGFSPGRSTAFHIGSLDGEQAPFMGAIARVRIWNTLVDENTDTSNLVAESVFSSEGLGLAVYSSNDAEVQP